MSLTMGSIAPLGRPTGGTLNIELPSAPAHLLFVHGLDRRIRGQVGDVTVVDTTAARMLHETRMLPRWYFPSAGVRTDLLRPSSTTSHCPFKGDARYWDLVAGDRAVHDAFWEYPEAGAGAPDLSGLLAPYTEKFDRWLEEEDEVHGHPRDPFHRVDVRRSAAHVVVRAGAEVVAESDDSLAVFETGLPTRWYLPAADVAQDMLSPSQTRTTCPYKGEASYWSVDAGGARLADVACAYQTPDPAAAALEGHLSFLGEGVGVEVTR
ncbi:MAG: DUF427 domain-containing protein [Acidimicrobiales bacterium]